jgi:pimeloyl-ACP methyl ester carboxylesterase
MAALCIRFRGTMDDWDPAFLGALAANGFQVITFDYSGLGLSTGDKDYSQAALAKDVKDLIEALDLHDVVVGGWSIGGVAAQFSLLVAADRMTHAVLIGTTPTVRLVKEAEQLFFDVASKPHYDLEDEVTLFFEPRSRISREAAGRSHERIAMRNTEKSIPVTVEWAVSRLGNKPRNPMYSADAMLEFLKTTTISVLHIGGNHDIVFSVENWYALNQQLPTLQLLTLPQAGHRPQHQYPEACAEYIATFVRRTPAEG